MCAKGPSLSRIGCSFFMGKNTVKLFNFPCNFSSSQVGFHVSRFMPSGISFHLKEME